MKPPAVPPAQARPPPLSSRHTCHPVRRRLRRRREFCVDSILAHYAPFATHPRVNSDTPGGQPQAEGRRRAWIGGLGLFDIVLCVWCLLSWTFGSLNRTATLCCSMQRSRVFTGRGLRRGRGTGSARATAKTGGPPPARPSRPRPLLLPRRRPLARARLGQRSAAGRAAAWQLPAPRAWHAPPGCRGPGRGWRFRQSSACRSCRGGGGWAGGRARGAGVGRRRRPEARQGWGHS